MVLDTLLYHKLIFPNCIFPFPEEFVVLAKSTDWDEMLHFVAWGQMGIQTYNPICQLKVTLQISCATDYVYMLWCLMNTVYHCNELVYECPLHKEE